VISQKSYIQLAMLSGNSDYKMTID